jgi:hypothetical protein
MIDCMRGGETSISTTIPCEKPDLTCHKWIPARPWPVEIRFDNMAAQQVAQCNQGYGPKHPPNGFLPKNLKRINNDKKIEWDMKNRFSQEKKQIIQYRMNHFTIHQKG